MGEDCVLQSGKGWASQKNSASAQKPGADKK